MSLSVLLHNLSVQQSVALTRHVLFSSFCCVKDRPTPVLSVSEVYVKCQEKKSTWTAQLEGACKAKIKY